MSFLSQSLSFLFFSFLHRQYYSSVASHAAPVWLSLVGWWSFLASSENQSDFLAPLFFAHPWHSHILQPSCSYYPPILFFPDCTASVHKSCRDSLPVCAKVKMKVSVPSDASRKSFFSVLLSCSQYWFEFLIYDFIISLASFPNSSLQFQTQALFLQSHWGTNVSDSLL